MIYIVVGSCICRDRKLLFLDFIDDIFEGIRAHLRICLNRDSLSDTNRFLNDRSTSMSSSAALPEDLNVKLPKLFVLQAGIQKYEQLAFNSG